MFDLDRWQEVFATMRKNKLRTFLTGFSVAWGIFMLIILLGSGQGMENAIQKEFKDDANNSIWIYTGTTSLPYKGIKPGRELRFTNEDHSRLQTSVDGVEHITSRFFVWSSTINYGKEYGTFSIRGVHPAHQYLENTIILNGRFLNETDLLEKRKVIVVSELVKSDLFKGEDPLGKYINVNGIPFKVIGVFTDEGGEGELRQIYIPITSAQTVFNGSNNVHQIMFTTKSFDLAESQKITEAVRQDFARAYNFDPEDQRAIHIRNVLEQVQEILGLFVGIRIFVWFIGIGTILAGIVGVSNIMLIVVKERTKEIGIRKAIGATPFTIVTQVLQEAVFITGVSGYFGLVAGVVVLEFMAANIKGVEYFKNPEVDFSVAISATMLLVFSGALSGLFPALRAAKIKPIEALREE